jgi:hypothetical protein
MRLFLNQRFHDWRENNKTTFLLLLLIAIQLVYPYSLDLHGGAALINVVISLIMISATLAVSDNPTHTKIGVALVIPALAIRWLDMITGAVILPVLTEMLEVVFFTYATYLVLRYVLGAGPITRDKLFGASAAYLLVATVFADLYHILERLSPGSFGVGDQLSEFSLRMELGYFSLVTLTTLGYGDITPLTPKARSLVILEAFFGVMYMATLVARLVSMYKTGDEAGASETSET